MPRAHDLAQPQNEVRIGAKQQVILLKIKVCSWLEHPVFHLNCERFCNYFNFLFENIYILSEVSLSRKGLFAYLAISSASDPSSDRGLCLNSHKTLPLSNRFLNINMTEHFICRNIRQHNV
jgi:hypothetical protein